LYGIFRRIVECHSHWILLTRKSDMRMGYSGNALGAAGASLEMLHDEVLIYNSYAIRDKLRALEFRFDSERRAWVRSVFEVCTLDSFVNYIYTYIHTHTHTHTHTLTHTHTYIYIHT